MLKETGLIRRQWRQLWIKWRHGEVCAAFRWRMSKVEVPSCSQFWELSFNSITYVIGDCSAGCKAEGQWNDVSESDTAQRECVYIVDIGWTWQIANRLNIREHSYFYLNKMNRNCMWFLCIGYCVVAHSLQVMYLDVRCINARLPVMWRHNAPTHEIEHIHILRELNG